LFEHIVHSLRLLSGHQNVKISDKAKKVNDQEENIVFNGHGVQFIPVSINFLFFRFFVSL